MRVMHLFGSQDALLSCHKDLFVISFKSNRDSFYTAHISSQLFCKSHSVQINCEQYIMKWFPLPVPRRSLVAQWIKCWPTDLGPRWRRKSTQMYTGLHCTSPSKTFHYPDMTKILSKKNVKLQVINPFLFQGGLFVPGPHWYKISVSLTNVYISDFER